MPRRRRRSGARKIAIVLLVIAALAALAWYLLRPSERGASVPASPAPRREASPKAASAKPAPAERIEDRDREALRELLERKTR